MSKLFCNSLNFIELLHNSRTIVHIKLARDHAVVHFAAFGRPFPVMGLKFHIRCDHIDAGGGMLLHALAEDAGQRSGFVQAAQPLAIRRIRQDDGVRAGGKIAHVCHLKAAALGHAGQFGVGIGQRHGRRVDVVADAFKAGVQPGFGQRLAALLRPYSVRNKAVALGGKAALEPRREVPQNGSITTLSRRTRPTSAMVAASVSLMGASVALRR